MIVDAAVLAAAMLGGPDPAPPTAYRFLAFDLMSNAALGEIPAIGISYSQVLNGVGAFNATIPLSSATAADTLAMTVPERTLIVVERNGPGNFVDAYIIWQRTKTMTAAGPSVSISAATINSLFHRNRLITDLPFTATDQLTIAQALLNAMQTQPGGNIGLIVGTAVCGVLRDRTQYFAYERPNIGEKLDQLAAVQNGFDWSIDIGGTPAAPTKTMNWSYPRKGRIAGTTGVVFASGKNLIGYNMLEDGTMSARSVDVFGTGDGADMLIATQSQLSLIDAGYPLTSEQIADRSVASPDTLAAHAIAAVTARAVTPTFWTFVVDPDDTDGGLGTWVVGDDIAVEINDDLFPRQDDGTHGFAGYRRILAATVNVPESGKETVTVTTGTIN